jgi:hypothetical protein
MFLDRKPPVPDMAAAFDDDPALMAELRAAFVTSAERQLDLLSRSRCDANWRFAAMRLHGIAASFDAGDVVMIADDALAGAPGDPVVIRRLAAAIARYAAD